MNSKRCSQKDAQDTTARTCRGRLLAGLGFFVLALCHFVVMGIYFNSTRNYNLHGKGLNLACQQESLSPLDHWICTDGRLNKTFFFYTDGSPYFLYRDLLEHPKYKNMSVGRMSRNLGLLDSGPSFRSSLIGRLDIDYANEIVDLDNVFHQTTNYTNHPIDGRTYFKFPLVYNLGYSSFHKMVYIPRKYDGIPDLCRDHFLTQDFDSDLGCKNWMDCQFTSPKAAVEFTSERYSQYRKILEPIQSSVAACLDQTLDGVESLILYQEKTDDLSHDWSAMHKVVLELHAKTKANLESLLDYFLEHRPDTLLVVYSDHGQTVVPWEGEYTNHGYNDGENKGFVLIINPLLQGKPLVKEVEVLTTDLFSGWQQLLYGANIPKWKKEIPGTLYENSPLEDLKILRSRHLQLQSLLGREAVNTRIWNEIDTSLLGPELLERTGHQKLVDLNKEYRAFLESLEPQFEKAVQKFNDPYKLWIYLIGAFVLAVDALVVYYRVKQAPADESRSWLKVGIAMLVVYHGCLAILVPIKSATYPIFTAVFLLVAAAGAYWYHRFMTIRFLPPKIEMTRNTIISAPSEHVNVVSAGNIWDFPAFRLPLIGATLLVALRTLSWFLVKCTTFRITNIENISHFFSKEIAVVGILSVSAMVFYLLWCAVSQAKTPNTGYKPTRLAARSMGLEGPYPTAAATPEVESSKSSHRSTLGRELSKNTAVLDFGQHRILSSKSSKLRSNLSRILLMINIALVLTMLLALGLYDFLQFRKGTFVQSSQMRVLVQVIYCLLPLLLLGTGCVPTHSGRYVLVAAAFVFCAFWATHLNRILYSILVLPTLIQILNSANSAKFIGWLSAFMLILQFGLFPANNEEYLFAVSQRCLKRLPIEHLDKNIVLTAVNTYCIKFATVIFLNLSLLTVETLDTLRDNSTILLAHLGMYLVSGKAIVSHEEERHSFIIIVGANMLAPCFRILLSAVHGWLQRITGHSVTTS